MFDIVAILGRGIQRAFKGGPWVLTEDLELCDKDSAHLPVHAEADDDSPFCMIGGGEMNLLAGFYLACKFKPAVMVCAHGGRSKYLESIGAPSESEVMTGYLGTLLSTVKHDPIGEFEIVIWPRERQLPVPANTRQELLNIFDLALDRGLSRIAIVTVGVHVPRTATYIAKHLSVYPQYRELNPVLLESEEVLLDTDREKYAARVETMRASKAFARNWAREADGIQKIVRDVYGDAKPKVVVA